AAVAKSVCPAIFDLASTWLGGNGDDEVRNQFCDESGMLRLGPMTTVRKLDPRAIAKTAGDIDRHLRRDERVRIATRNKHRAVKITWTAALCDSLVPGSDQLLGDVTPDVAAQS